MVTEIILCRRMPPVLDRLDYLVPIELKNKLKVGHLVRVPFRNHQEFGIVWKMKSGGGEGAKKLKNIAEIIGENPALTHAQLGFLFDMARLYQTPLGLVVKSNLLPLQKRKLSRIQFIEQNNKIPSSNKKPSILVYTCDEEKEQILKSIISPKGQTLILTPEIPDIEKICSLIGKPPHQLGTSWCGGKFRSDFTTLSSIDSPKKMFDKWTRISEGKARIVIGTRRALFLPWSDLRSIIVDDEGNPSHKSWDMAPRFNAKDAALILGRHFGAKVYFAGHTPSVESFYLAARKNYPCNELAKNLKTFDLPQPEIIDMRQERKSGNYDFLSVDLVKSIRQDGPGDVFLFLNRRGSMSYVGCRDCGWVAKCPNCKITLTYHEDTRNMQCHYCHYIEETKGVCPNCRGTAIAMYGVGTQLAENMVRKMLGSKPGAQVLRIDADAKKLTELNNDLPKIIIGTELAWPRVNWDKLRLMAFVDADSSLYVPEYKAQEEMWQNLRDASYRLRPEAKFIVQTSRPDHAVFKALFNPLLFYVENLKERSALGYPPYAYLLRLLYSSFSEAESTKAAARLFADLESLTKTHPYIKIMNPSATEPPLLRGKYYQMILIKIKQGFYGKAVETIMSKVPANWKVDPNPNRIVSIS